MSKYVTYKQSGVSIDSSDRMEDLIYPHVAGTFGPRVMELKGGFAGLFRLDYDEKIFKKNYKSPVLVACTDGVGSKVQLAAQMKKYDTVGIDLVAMNVNDMLVQGAETPFKLIVAEEPEQVYFNKDGEILAEDLLINQSW